LLSFLLNSVHFTERVSPLPCSPQAVIWPVHTLPTQCLEYTRLQFLTQVIFLYCYLIKILCEFLMSYARYMPYDPLLSSCLSPF